MSSIHLCSNPQSERLRNRINHTVFYFILHLIDIGRVLIINCCIWFICWSSILKFLCQPSHLSYFSNFSTRLIKSSNAFFIQFEQYLQIRLYLLNHLLIV
ncbi:predicted protein [Enterococcus faecalis DS5]|nr:predicted protein [Enterococcus faecalis DS5]